MVGDESEVVPELGPQELLGAGGGRAVSTGTGDKRTTFSATLPSSA